MRLARVSLLLAALAFAGFGLVTLAFPWSLGVIGIELIRPAAETEIRAFYGGLELGMAVFLARAAMTPAWFRPALFAQTATLGCVALARALGMTIDGGIEPLTVALGAGEGAAAVLGLVALRRLAERECGS